MIRNDNHIEFRGEGDWATDDYWEKDNLGHRITEKLGIPEYLPTSRGKYITMTYSINFSNMAVLARANNPELQKKSI